MTALASGEADGYLRAINCLQQVSTFLDLELGTLSHDVFSAVSIRRTGCVPEPLSLTPLSTH